MVDLKYVKISQKNRNLRKATKTLIWTFLKGEIMDDFYSDENVEKRTILDIITSIMS